MNFILNEYLDIVVNDLIKSNMLSIAYFKLGK